MTTPTSSESLLEMRERFQRLKQIERTKYICPDYARDSIAGWSNYTHDDKAALLLRLKRVLVVREQALHGLDELASNLGVDRSIMSNAAFIFDRYLSTFVPQYVNGHTDLPHMFDRIGIASLFIAVKSEWGRRELAPIEEFLRFSRFRREILSVELKILVELDWDITYQSPISIIQDWLTLLPRQCGCQESAATFGAFEEILLNETSYLTWLSAVTYRCATKYPPLTIALAALMIAFETQTLVSNVSSNLVNPVVQFKNLAKRFGQLGLRWNKEEVKLCRKRILNVLKKQARIDSVDRDTCPSPTNVAELSDS